METKIFEISQEYFNGIILCVENQLYVFNLLCLNGKTHW